MSDSRSVDEMMGNHIETSTKDRKCHRCGSVIKAGVKHTRHYYNNQHGQSYFNFCSDCLKVPDNEISSMNDRIKINDVLGNITDFDSLILNQEELIKLVSETVDPYLAELIEGTLLILSSEEIPEQIKKLKEYLTSQSPVKNNKAESIINVVNKINNLETFDKHQDELYNSFTGVFNSHFIDLLTEVYRVMSDDDEVVDEMKRLRKTVEEYSIWIVN